MLLILEIEKQMKITLKTAELNVNTQAHLNIKWCKADFQKWGKKSMWWFFYFYRKAKLGLGIVSKNNAPHKIQREISPGWTVIKSDLLCVQVHIMKSIVSVFLFMFAVIYFNREATGKIINWNMEKNGRRQWRKPPQWSLSDQLTFLFSSSFF